ncbi:MAG: hypothetical protein HOA49_01770 [Flavobacteriales bacterium]|nr:hypothetical protein [Flavobacteriales bacterium]
MSHSLIDIEIKNISKEYKSKKIYEGIKEKIEKGIDDNTLQLKEIEQEIINIKNRHQWFDWIGQMNREIDEMKDWSFDDKKEKLNKFLDSISVVYDNKVDKHRLSLDFNLPIVDDTIVYKDFKEKTKGYKIKKGKDKVTISYKSDWKQQQQTEEKKRILIEIRRLLQDGLGYGEVSEYLNKNNIKTISRNKKWSRQLVRYFYKYNSKLIEIPKSFKITDYKKKGLVS